MCKCLLLPVLFLLPLQVMRAQDNINALAEQEEETRKKAEEFAKKYAAISKTDALSIIGQSADTENIAQAEKAIQDLKEARDKLDNTDAETE